MANTAKLLFRGAASTSNTTLYTVPNSSTSTIITSIVVSNASSSQNTFTILIDSIELFYISAINANSTASFDIKQVIPANATPKTITGSASSSSVKFHISGVEIS